MAPRTLLMLTCFSVGGGNVPLPVADQEAATHGATKRRWSGEIKRKILASARRARVRAVKEEEEDDVDPRDNVDVEKKRAPERKIVELRRPALRRGGSPRDDGAPEAVAADGVRERKGLRVRFDLPGPGAEEASAVEPRFPTGVLGEAPESFAHLGPEMTAAFLMSVAAGAGRATAVDNELVARWTERKQACSRRLRYLRDHCPFHREEEEEKSAPETTTLPAERDHAKEVLATLKTTGLPFDSPEFEGEFVNAICSRYLLKDDFISRYGYGTDSLVRA